MIRAIFWILVYILFLGMMNITVKYADGFSIKIHSWLEFFRKRRNR